MQKNEQKPHTTLGGFDWTYLVTEWKSMLRADTWGADLCAGATVALVALPLNLALAISAGVEPGIGVTTGIVAAVVASLFGGQRLAITGPAAAMAVVLVEVAKSHGIEAIWLIGLIAGIMQVLSGFFKFGKIISYIPMPVMVGFANGIGILVLFNAIDDFMGLTGKTVAHAHHLDHLAKVGVPQFFLDVGDVFIRGFIGHELNPAAVSIGALALFIAVAAARFTKRIPGALVAIVVATAASSLLQLHIPTIATISHIPNVLPMPSMPDVPWDDFATLFPAALTVFMLGSIESLLSASVADGMIMSPTKHNSNQELIGQGLANLIVPFFGGIPVTGVIARTAVNIRAGARTRLSSMIHSAVLMILIFFLAPFAEKIPLSALAAILILTGFRLIEWDALREIWKASKAEAWAVFATTMASVCVDLTAGVIVGLIVACALFIRQMSRVELIDIHESTSDAMTIPKVPRCQYVKTYAVEGPLFFGAAERFIENIMIVDNVKAIVLHMGAAKVMDLTGVETLLSIHRQLHRNGGKLVLSNVPPQPLELLERTGAVNTIGRQNVYRDFRTAVLSVNNEMLESTCGSCHYANASSAKTTAGALGALKKITGLINKSGGADANVAAEATDSAAQAAPEADKGPANCSLRRALCNESNPIGKQMRELKAQQQRLASGAEPQAERHDWLVCPENQQAIPSILQGTPIETLIKGQNFGEIDADKAGKGELIIGMCIDHRNALSIPHDWAYIIRREGANMAGSEFAIALAISKGITHMALIAHNQCAMANTMDQREEFIDTLERHHGWSRDRAARFFDEQGRSRDIGNEIDFVMDESKRLMTVYPALTVVPLVCRLEDERLYFVLDWLMEHAPQERITSAYKDRLIGKMTNLPRPPQPAESAHA